MKNEVLFYLGFSHFLGIGPMRFAALIKKFGQVKKAYQASESELTDVIGKNLAEKFVHFRQDFDPVKKMEELRKKEIEVIPLYSASYPESLKNITDPPICLYIKSGGSCLEFPPAGARFEQYPSTARRREPFLLDTRRRSFSQDRSPSSSMFFAIVGTRKPTPYGEKIAKKFAYELSSAGFIIVSGLAMGIDAAAHWGALEAGGKTIAVLGCGVDIVYPAVNRRLYEKIVNGGGAVISEFPPGHMVAKGLFIARNRIISGISAGVLVVEGLKDSGSLITARYAACQGKEVFAPPGPLTSQMSEAPNILLKQGAKLATSVEDIFEELGVKVLPKEKKKIEGQLSLEEKNIFEILEKEPMIVDDLALKLNQPISQVLNIVSLLEIKGVIEKNKEGKYQVKF